MSPVFITRTSYNNTITVHSWTVPHLHVASRFHTRPRRYTATPTPYSTVRCSTFTAHNEAAPHHRVTKQHSATPGRNNTQLNPAFTRPDKTRLNKTKPPPDIATHCLNCRALYLTSPLQDFALPRQHNTLHYLYFAICNYTLPLHHVTSQHMTCTILNSAEPRQYHMLPIRASPQPDSAQLNGTSAVSCVTELCITNALRHCKVHHHYFTLLGIVVLWITFT